MAKPMVTGKGTKKDDSMGEFGRKRGGVYGKGDMVSAFNDRWVESIERQFSKRRYPCSNPTCGKYKPSGICPHCQYDPGPRRGW